MVVHGVPKNILVTGGAGFIGSHLVDMMATAGLQVTVLDDYSSPAGPGAPDLEDRNGVDLVQGSVLDESLVAELVEPADLVIHLAAVVGVRRVLEEPVRAMDVNVRGSEVVMRAASTTKTAVLYASSSDVYGKNPQLPFNEAHAPVLSPPQFMRWSYAVSKLHGEMYGFALHKTTGLPFLAVRMFNVVGPGQRWEQGMVLPGFVRAALNNEPITVYEPATQRRSFQSVRNAVRILWKLAERPWSTAEVLNVGNPQPVSIMSLAERVKYLSHSSSEIKVVEPRAVLPVGYDDVVDRVPDCSRLIEHVGPLSFDGIDEIIGSVIEAMRSDQDATDSEGSASA